MINGKIYKVVNTEDDLLYIGSTIQKLCVRMARHRFDGRNGSECQIHKHMARVGVEHFKIVLIENYECKTKEELRAREDFYIQQFDTVNCGLNGRSAVSAPDARKMWCKRYHERNRDKQLLRKKKYYQLNRKTELLKAKKRMMENKEKYLLRNRKYNESNKYKFRCRVCELYKPSRSAHYKHLDTKTHIKKEEQQMSNWADQ